METSTNNTKSSLQILELHFIFLYLQASLIQQQARDVNALQDNAVLQLARCEAVQQRLEEAEEKLEEAQQLGIFPPFLRQQVALEGFSSHRFSNFKPWIAWYIRLVPDLLPEWWFCIHIEWFFFSKFLTLRL